MSADCTCEVGCTSGGWFELDLDWKTTTTFNGNDLDSRLRGTCFSQSLQMRCFLGATSGGRASHDLLVLFGCLLAVSLFVNGILLWRLKAARKQLKEAAAAEPSATPTTTTTPRRTDGAGRGSGSNGEAVPLTAVATEPDSDPTAVTTLSNGGQVGTNGCLAGGATMPNGVGDQDAQDVTVVT